MYLALREDEEMTAYHDMLRGEGLDDQTIESFVSWHIENRHIWEAFEKFAIESAECGKKIGAKAIMERVRWDMEVERGEDFKVKNSYTAYYARVFAKKHPEFKDLFEYRQLRGLKL